MSPTEILEKAQAIQSRETGEQYIYNQEESDILREARAIQESRSRSGVGKIIDKLMPSLVGQRRAAEIEIERIRATEAKVEALANRKASLAIEAAKAKTTLERLREQNRHYRDASTDRGIRDIFLKTYWARTEANFHGHLKLAATEIFTAQILGREFHHFVDQQATDLAAIEAEAKAVDGELSKIK